MFEWLYSENLDCLLPASTKEEPDCLQCASKFMSRITPSFHRKWCTPDLLLPPAEAAIEQNSRPLQHLGVLNQQPMGSACVHRRHGGAPGYQCQIFHQ